MSKKDSLNWWEMPADQAYEAAFATVSFLDKNQSYINDEFLRFAKLYGNADILGLTSSTYSRSDQGSGSSRLTLNVIKSCCDTVTAKIAKNRPRAYFLTSGGNYNQQKKAKQLTKFVEGMFYQTDIYKKAPQIKLDSTVWGWGALKIFEAGPQKITCERVLPCELFFDDVEAFYGYPRQMHQVKYLDRKVLMSMFPKKKTEIMNASKRLNKEFGVGLSLADQIPVIESWRLASGPDQQDGRHMLSIDTANLYDDKKYERQTFPFVFLKWSERLMGFRGTGIAEELMGIQLEINRILKTIQLSMRLCSVPKVFVENGSKVVLEHINNEIGGIIRYTGNKPNYEAINAVPGELFAQLDRLYSRAYEITGISALSAQSRKPSGLDSGKALREFSDIESERFALKQQAYENMFVEAAEQMIDLAKEIYDRDGDFKVTHVGPKNIEKIDWSDVKMSDDEYVIKIFPTSSLSQTPAGRLQDVQELLQAGFISKEDGLKLLDFPDLESVMNLKNAAVNDILNVIDRMIEKNEYTAPEPYQNLAYGIEKFQSAYLMAKTNGVEEETLELLRRWMSEADALLQSLQAPAEPIEDPLAVPEAAPASDLLPLETAAQV